jgi:hypothetical protein
MCLGSAILPYTYIEIRDNHTCLVSAILPCPYVEIKDNHTGLSVTYFGVFNFGTSYLGAKIGQNKTMTKIS